MKNNTYELTTLRAEAYVLIMENAQLTAQYQSELKALNERYKPQFDTSQSRLNALQTREAELVERDTKLVDAPKD